MPKLARKKPTNFDELEADIEEAEKLGLKNVDELYNPKIISIGVGDFISKKLPKRQYIISPCLPQQGLMMIYAKRGIGKTYFALLLASKIASGENLFNDRWQIAKKWKVLYLDGEMPANAMQERLKTLISNHNQLNQHLEIITRDLQTNGLMPNIADEEGQESLDIIIKDFDVVIIDNLSTLARGGKENEASSWNLIGEWALKLRSLGKSIIFIHHAGKNNSQRGTSKREDILDTVINLKNPSNYSQEEGARFEVHFEKSRGFAGDEAKPFEVKLNLANDKANWQISEIEDLEIKQVVELHNLKMTQRDIASEVGLSLSKVNRILKQFKEV